MGLGDIFSGIAGFGSKVGNFLSDISPLLEIGGGIYGISQKHKAQQEQIDAERRAAREDYDNAKAAAEAYNAQLGQGGGGGGGGRKAAAIREAIAYQQQMGKKAAAQLDPWINVGKRLMPQVENTYRGSLNGMDALLSYLSSPEQMKKLDGRPETVKIKLPEYMRGA